MSTTARHARMLDATTQVDPFATILAPLPDAGNARLVRILKADRPLTEFERAYVERCERGISSC